MPFAVLCRYLRVVLPRIPGVLDGRLRVPCRITHRLLRRCMLLRYGKRSRNQRNSESVPQTVLL
jgi:hypothetical protein